LESMSNPLDIALDTILSPVGMAQTELDRVLDQLLAPAIDAADAYFQSSRLESWVLEDGIIKEGSHSIEQGAGVRAVSGEKTGFAYSDELHMPALLEAAGAARAIVRGGSEGRVQVRGRPTERRLYPPLNPLASLGDEEKVALLRRVDAEARRLDPRVKQVIVSLVAAHDVVLVAGNDGSLNGDVRPLVRIMAAGRTPAQIKRSMYKEPPFLRPRLCRLRLCARRRVGQPHARQCPAVLGLDPLDLRVGPGAGDLVLVTDQLVHLLAHHLLGHHQGHGHQRATDDGPCQGQGDAELRRDGHDLIVLAGQ